MPAWYTFCPVILFVSKKPLEAVFFTDLFGSPVFSHQTLQRVSWLLSES